MVYTTIKPLKVTAVPEIVEAEGSWRSPSQDSMLLRKPRRALDVKISYTCWYLQCLFHKMAYEPDILCFTVNAKAVCYLAGSRT